MGCQESKTEQQKDEIRRNKEVEKALKQDKGAFMSEIKLLLLGTGESGKSTIAKQMKILHTESGFTKQELLSFKPVVFNNCFSSMKAIWNFCQKVKIELDEENLVHIKAIDEQQNIEIESFTQEMADHIKALWKDKGIQEAYKRRNEYQLIDGAEYCFLNADKFAKPDYVPDETDVLRVRARTTGIIETIFKVRDSNFRMVDVGGQRSERKKWIHCFQDVTAIIYCVALNEYDMKLFEDERINRMAESLELFEEICNSKWFTKTAIIMFMNKIDLFKEKVNKVNINCLFEDYTGPAEEAPSLEFIKNKFISLNKNQNKKIFVHVTSAIDTEQVRVVFDAAKEIIISQNLERLGFGQL